MANNVNAELSASSGKGRRRSAESGTALRSTAPAYPLDEPQRPWDSQTGSFASASMRGRSIVSRQATADGLGARAMILKSETYNFHRLDLTRQNGLIVTVYDEHGLSLAATEPCASPAAAFAEGRKIINN